MPKEAVKRSSNAVTGFFSTAAGAVREHAGSVSINRKNVPHGLLKDKAKLESYKGAQFKALVASCSGDNEQARAQASTVADTIKSLVAERTRLTNILQEDYRSITDDLRFQVAGAVSAGTPIASWLLGSASYLLSTDECAASPSSFWTVLAAVGLSGASLYWANDKYEGEKETIKARLDKLDAEIDKLVDVLEDSDNADLVPVASGLSSQSTSSPSH